MAGSAGLDQAAGIFLIYMKKLVIYSVYCVF